MKPVEWCGDSRKRIQEFPASVRHGLGIALMQAQFGGKAIAAKPLHGFGGAGVLEVIEDYRGDTYRARLHREVTACGLCAALLSKEEHQGQQGAFG